MLTTTCSPSVSETPILSHNEIPSDAEISRRVLQIRAGWTVGERVNRRREAEKRFADLLDALMNAA